MRVCLSHRLYLVLHLKFVRWMKGERKMDEYIKKETAINVLREMRERHAEVSLIEGTNALLTGINAIKAIEAEDVIPASYTTPFSVKERARVERALGIIEGATSTFRHDGRYEGVESMLITAVDMIEYVLNKGEYAPDKGE